MNSLVLDTHSVIWFLAVSTRLSTVARQAIRDAIDNNFPVYVSVISIVEVIYLVEKGRFSDQVLEDLLDAIKEPTSGIQLADLTADDAVTLQSVPRSDVPDMPDRIIAATALHLGLPLVTADSRLQAASIPTVW